VWYSILLAKQERYSFAEYLRPYLGSHIFAVYSAGDRRPFIKRCIDAVRMAVAPGARTIEHPAFETVSIRPPVPMERG
jgi:hypothetical protein